MIEIEKNENNLEDNKEIENFSNVKLKKTLNFNEILCTAILFLSAGFETTALTLCNDLFIFDSKFSKQNAHF